MGTLNLLDAARKAGIEKFIFSSTCATYGLPEKLPLDEDHPQNPINPYGQGKLAVERALRDFDRAYGLRHVNLRYFNAAGAAPEGGIGEWHEPETHLIPLALQAALGRRPKVEVFGIDYDTPDGTCLRDYVHVDDLAAAHLLVLEYLEGGAKSDSFNLGNGNGFSVKEVIETARKVSGKRINAEPAPRREGDPPRLVAASEKAQKVLGWRPE